MPLAITESALTLCGGNFLLEPSTFKNQLSVTFPFSKAGDSRPGVVAIFNLSLILKDVRV